MKYASDARNTLLKGFTDEHNQPLECVRVDRPTRGPICTLCRKDKQKCSLQEEWKAKRKASASSSVNQFADLVKKCKRSWLESKRKLKC